MSAGVSPAVCAPRLVRTPRAPTTAPAPLVSAYLLMARAAKVCLCSRQSAWPRGRVDARFIFANLCVENMHVCVCVCVK